MHSLKDRARNRYSCLNDLHWNEKNLLQTTKCITFMCVHIYILYTHIVYVLMYMHIISMNKKCYKET